ncbi:MAG: energy transducer TonB [Limisphaerales bacterium]
MSRLEKKCFVTSAVVHVLLVAVLLIGSAFVASRSQSDNMPVLDVIPSRLVDAALSGGGNPNAQPLPPSPIILRETVTPIPTPPVVKPQREREQLLEPPKPEPRVKPKKPTRREEEVEKDFKPSPRSAELPPKPSPKKIKPTPPEVNLTPVERGTAPSSSVRERTRRAAQEREAAAAAELARRKEFASAVEGLRQNLSPGIQVAVPGPGGEAYANYGLAVRSIYDHAWILPDEVTDDSLTVQVVVTVARDGTVVADRTRIKRRSGNAVADRTVQKALDRVKFIGPFPEGAKELEREFIINFNVKAKRLLG